MKPLLIVARKISISTKTKTKTMFCDKFFMNINLTSRRCNQNQAFNNYQREISNIITKNIIILNQYYERFFGIAEVRQIQSKVLEIESEFVEITRKRKSCQDKIDKFKENIKELREKLDTLPRSSDNYLNLITTEHKLLRDQLSFEAELSQLKEKEQLALDSFSALLRQSHEIERLRQDRSKYWQIITAAITTVGYTVALITQKSRTQKSLSHKLDAMRLEMGDEKQLIEQKLDIIVKHIQESDKKVDTILNDIDQLYSKLSERTQVKISSKEDSSWTSYIPGLTTVVSWFYYQHNRNG